MGGLAVIGIAAMCIGIIPPAYADSSEQTSKTVSCFPGTPDEATITLPPEATVLTPTFQGYPTFTLPSTGFDGFPLNYTINGGLGYTGASTPFFRNERLDPGNYMLVCAYGAELSDYAHQNYTATFIGTASITASADYSNARTITYKANGGAGSDVTLYKKIGSTVSIESGDLFTASNGEKFTEWNTAPDGSGTAYKEDASFTMPDSDMTLYAQWQSVGTTIACAPQTGDPASSIWQWSSYGLAAVMVVLGGIVLRLRRRL